MCVYNIKFEKKRTEHLISTFVSDNLLKNSFNFYRLRERSERVIAFSSFAFLIFFSFCFKHLAVHSGLIIVIPLYLFTVWELPPPIRAAIILSRILHYHNARIIVGVIKIFLFVFSFVLLNRKVILESSYNYIC